MTILQNAFDQLSNPYERQARLYPALLALAPLVTMGISLYGEKLGLVSAVSSALITCGVLFLLSEFARRLGKKQEQALWKKWGGTPSTQVLRHSDETFDAVTTTRYHLILAKKLGRCFPNEQEEALDPKAADAIYTSAGNMLREVTKDTKQFNLLFKDNISYGFRRNGLGIKRIGIAICFCSIFWLVARQDIGRWTTRLPSLKEIESLMSAGEFLTLAVSLVMLLFWFFYFTEDSVRDAAFSYARKLVLACESLARPSDFSKSKA